MITWKLTQKAVNNKTLFKEISEIVEDGFGELGIIWSSDTHRESFVELLEDILDERAELGLIEQFRVVCDGRNNKVSLMEKGQYTIDVYYKQAHCLNTTQLRYTIQEQPDEILALDLNDIII